MKKIKLFFWLFGLSVISQAQPQRSDNWYFGVYAGLNFSLGTPVTLTNGALYTTEGCATISDTTGSLLFYTDGVSVWNRNHVLMPNGTGLHGDPSSTQSGIIVAAPGTNSQYYLFTMDETGGPDGLQYSIVDMNLAGALGDVDSTQKNIPVEPFMTEKLIAVQQLNTPNFWIATHKWGTDEFYVYNLTPAGLQLTPVISHSGIVHNTSVIQNTYGQMKFNVCGNKLALAVSYQDSVELFDFNNATGVVYNPITLPIGSHVYGIEFSKNSHFLYVSTYDPAATLVQFDLTSGNAATILASQTTISVTPDIYALQLANDGKIYVTRSWSTFLGVINFPELSGLACDYVDNGVDLDPNFTGTTSSLGLPALTASYLRGETFCNVTIGINQSSNVNNHFVIYPNPSSNDFTLSLINAGENVLISVYDDAGRLTEQVSAMQGSIARFGKSLAPGFYVAELKNETGCSYQRMIKF